MPSRLPHFTSFLLPAMIVALIVLSILSLANSIRRSALVEGGIDLHPYWYYGHFVRYGMNPFTAYAHRNSLPDPVQYLDGSEIAADMVAQPNKARHPANLASTLLITSLLSFLPWQPAMYTWFIINLALLIAIPWLTLRLLPPSLKLKTGLQWLIAFAFYSDKATRTALLVGQPSIMIFFLMIVTLLLRQSHWIWAGLALGLALGKYSISLPVVIFLFVEKRFRVLFVAILVQVSSLLVVSALDGGSIWETVQVYWRLLTMYSGGQPGVHLGSGLFGSPEFSLVLVVIGTCATVVMLVFCFRRGMLAADVLPVNSLLGLWTLLAAYHRNYDTMLALLFLIVCLSAINTWNLPTRQIQILSVFWVLVVLVMCVPGEMSRNFLPADQAEMLNQWIAGSLTAALVAMWGVNLWLIYKTPRVNE